MAETIKSLNTHNKKNQKHATHITTTAAGTNSKAPQPSRASATKINRDSLAELSFKDLLSVRSSVGQKTFNKIWTKTSETGLLSQTETGSDRARSKRRQRSVSPTEEGHSDDPDHDLISGDDQKDTSDDDSGSDSDDDSLDDDSDEEDDNNGPRDQYGKRIEKGQPSDTALDKGIERPRFKKTKRENKNMPMEATSKKPVSRKRQVVEVVKKISRDPRFEGYTGKFNEDLFQRSYGFIGDYERSEIEMLKGEIRSESNPERRLELQRTMTSKTSRLSTNEEKAKCQHLKREWRKAEDVRVQQGKTPFFLKNSELKRRRLEDKFKSLSEKGVDLDKVLEKRRKKNASREHRHIPAQRRAR
ncbi:hypothetical protein BASA50_001247 [Batrachochytrium salamandrivorans]|uniref:rRNA biogenesis protein RRP36 n=1 Tax=Batrachochytrium salamandrivorans TaxID=1357716 RepID=A0ABQ8ES18_9FUNG|nr:hypothetical protein BASA61_010264 [Batrachochytrium salamandrivorans]KAH6585639.1 hypothetical protein BASA50_001247 [Batrachochytrium salamandrivorans]